MPAGENEFTVLIVDDEKSNIDVLSYILQNDYNVTVAKSGEAALKRAAKDKPDLILLDIIMDDMNGYQVLAELREDAELKKIPVMFITGLSTPEDEEKGLTLGAVDYICKPFNPAIVKARVATHIKIVKQMKTIERFGLIDALTELPNKRSFNNTMEIEWGRGLRQNLSLSLLMIDIDYFKIYNDTYGHPQGDVVLKKVAKAILTSVKRITDLAYRWGGEEFAVILPETQRDGATVVAEGIRVAVEAVGIPTKRNGEDFVVTVSLGAASLMPNSASTSMTLIEHADKALYNAKRSGRNRVCTFTNMDEEL
jgi:diguanylate cyclase (GGDEF)-like protein